MEKILQIAKLLKMFLLLPFLVLKGSKKRAYNQVKKMMIAANIL